MIRNIIIPLKELYDRLIDTIHLEGNHVYYLAMAPQFFGTIVNHLKSQHIISEECFDRLIIEKPFVLIMNLPTN